MKKGWLSVGLLASLAICIDAQAGETRTLTGFGGTTLSVTLPDDWMFGTDPNFRTFNCRDNPDVEGKVFIQRLEGAAATARQLAERSRELDQEDGEAGEIVDTTLGGVPASTFSATTSELSRYLDDSEKQWKYYVIKGTDVFEISFVAPKEQFSRYEGDFNTILQNIRFE